MSEGITITFPQYQVDYLTQQMLRAEEKLNKSFRESTEWAGRLLCESVAGATKKSATKRPIVRNPDPRAGIDKRVGIFGVMKYIPYGNGAQRFDPIYKGGEFGQSIKYISPTETLLKMPNGKWEKYTNEELKQNQVPDMQMSRHPKTKIGRSGLAKKVWRWCMGHTRSTGSGAVMGMPNLAEVIWQKDSLILKSNLRYAMDAFKHKGAELGVIMGKAGDNLRYRIDLKLGLIEKEIVK